MLLLHVSQEVSGNLQTLRDIAHVGKLVSLDESVIGQREILGDSFPSPPTSISDSTFTPDSSSSIESEHLVRRATGTLLDLVATTDTCEL